MTYKQNTSFWKEFDTLHNLNKNFIPRFTIANFESDNFFRIIYSNFKNTKSYQVLFWSKVISVGMAYAMFSFVSNLVVFCLDKCWINCLFAIQSKRLMMKTANQEFITFTEPITYFYFIDASYFVHIFSHFLKAYINITFKKLKSRKAHWKIL